MSAKPHARSLFSHQSFLPMSYLSLEEAAAKLGISTDRLVELRSQGQVRGFRDGSSWKFPEASIDQLAEDLASEGAGSGVLVNESKLGDSAGIGSVIGGDSAAASDESDLNIGSEPTGEGSDVNLVTGSSDKDGGSDVELVASDSGDAIEAVDDESLFDADSENLQEIDSAELNLNDPAILQDSEDSIDIAIDPKEGSTGPVAKAEIQAEAEKIKISDVDITDDASADASGDEFAFGGDLAEDDSDDSGVG